MSSDKVLTRDSSEDVGYDGMLKTREKGLIRVHSNSCRIDMGAMMANVTVRVGRKR